MLKITKYMPILCFSTLVLTGCLQAPSHAPTATQNANQICANLKHEILMNRVGNGPTELRDNPAKGAQLYNAYHDAGCDHSH